MNISSYLIRTKKYLIFIAWISFCTLFQLEANPIPELLNNISNTHIYFQKAPPKRTKLLTPIGFTWKPSSEEENLEYRFKLDCPGDFLGGIRYAYNKWSSWGNHVNVNYSNFAKEGKYKFTVQGREKDRIQNIFEASYAWHMYWEYPEVREEGFKINWNKINGTTTKKERYALLAEEYHQAYLMWNRDFLYQSKLLKLTTSPEDIIKKISGNITTEADMQLLSWADKSTSVAASKIFLPKIIYDLIREGILDLILIYRNQQTNRSCTMTVISYYAWKLYLEKSDSYYN